MTLGDKQRLFTHYVGSLIIWLYDNGYEATLGDAYRDPRLAALNAKPGPNGEPPKGIANSLHCEKLAIDLNLFKDGIYLTGTESYRPMGEFWESLHPLARWGGRFTKMVNGEIKPWPDSGHFSFEHERRK